MGLVALASLLAVSVPHVLAQTVQAGPEWTQGRSGGWGNRSDRQRRSEYERRSDAPRDAKAVVVPANVAWTNTRIPVTRGQWLRFERRKIARAVELERYAIVRHGGGSFVDV